jgi:glycosyltransferase involved in cell wall biosynthesis
MSTSEARHPRVSTGSRNGGGSEAYAVDGSDIGPRSATRDVIAPTRPKAVELRRGVFRVVRIIARMNVGGPALNAINLSAGLANEFPTLLVTGSVGPGEKDVIQEAVRSGIPIHVIPELGPSMRAGSDAIALARILRVLWAVRPEIVHTHTAKAGALGRIAASVARVPAVVHTFHGHVFSGYFSPVVTAAAVRIERMLGRCSDAIVTVSPTVARQIVEDHAVVGRDRMHVIPLGFDFSRFPWEDRARLRQEFRSELLAGDRPVVTSVGRLEPIKNHELLMRAAASLAANGSNALFVFVGGGTLLRPLNQLAEELGISEAVRFLGWRSDIERVYAGSDVVALTSNNEGTPVCLIEALSMGVPVVATRVGGVTDVLEDGRLGRMVSPADLDGLAAALLDTLKEPDCLPLEAAQSVRAKYDVCRLLTDTRDLYRTLTQRPRC